MNIPHPSLFKATGNIKPQVFPRRRSGNLVPWMDQGNQSRESRDCSMGGILNPSHPDNLPSALSSQIPCQDRSSASLNIPLVENKQTSMRASQILAGHLLMLKHESFNLRLISRVCALLAFPARQITGVNSQYRQKRREDLSVKKILKLFWRLMIKISANGHKNLLFSLVPEWHKQ